jgi:hypothetical protein
MTACRFRGEADIEQFSVRNNLLRMTPSAVDGAGGLHCTLSVYKHGSDYETLWNVRPSYRLRPKCKLKNRATSSWYSLVSGAAGSALYCVWD